MPVLFQFWCKYKWENLFRCMQCIFAFAILDPLPLAFWLHSNRKWGIVVTMYEIWGQCTERFLLNYSDRQDSEKCSSSPLSLLDFFIIHIHSMKSWRNATNCRLKQGSHKPGKHGKPGIAREFCKPGKVREKSGNLQYGQGFFYEMSHFLWVAYLTCINYVTRLFLCNQHF